MKKFRKFMFGTLSLVSVAAGAYYLYKNYIKKDTSDDFDDFDDFDDCEDFDTDNNEENDSSETTREYVSINLTDEEPLGSPGSANATLEDTGEVTESD